MARRQAMRGGAPAPGLSAAKHLPGKGHPAAIGLLHILSSCTSWPPSPPAMCEQEQAPPTPCLKQEEEEPSAQVQPPRKTVILDVGGDR